MNEQSKAKIRVMLIEAMAGITDRVASEELISVIYWSKNLEACMADAAISVLVAASESCEATMEENGIE